MPDRLDDLLRAARSDVLEEIKGPDLVRVGARARTLRRRRRTSIAGAFAAVVAIGVTALVNTGRPQTLPGPAASVTPSPSRAIYQGAGLTIIGLANGESPELPGYVHDVQFVDPDHGYALLYDCTRSPCEASFATTTDGGYTWRQRLLPYTVTSDNVPTLVPLGPTQVLLTGSTPYLSSNFGGSWTALTLTVPPDRASVPGGTLTTGISLEGTADICPNEVCAWLPDGVLVRLAHQPGIRVYWVAPAKSGDGAWWVGGVDSTGRPALAVSRDDGRTWKVKTFPAPAAGAWAKAITVGSEVYATVVTGETRSADTRRGYEPGELTVRALYLSGNGGATFAPYGDGQPVTMVGDLVAMLDGRLIVATPPKFNVSSVDGTGFKPVPDDMPPVGVIRRTAVGWVAYNLFNSGWTAYTVDGQTWHKIIIH
jgi:hypothetical protein